MLAIGLYNAPSCKKNIPRNGGCVVVVAAAAEQEIKKTFVLSAYCIA
jgi:hypothetical protein